MPDSQAITYRHLLHKAWPIILANAAVPLLGLVDTAVIGNFGSLADLGAIALGALIFSFVYWSFGFLRMGTTGFAARADGAGDSLEVRAVLGRALLLAGVLGTSLIALQRPIGWLAFALLDGSDNVEAAARTYFAIRIWGAPATLAGFACMGLLIGLGRSKQLLVLQLFLNGLNVLLDVLFAGWLGLGAAGIALGTVLAEWSTLGFTAWLLGRSLRPGNAERFWPGSRILHGPALLATLSANLNIMWRTLILVFSFAFFVNQSARFGEVVLAANHILLQLISFSAFFLDGYAFVVESLAGKARGRRDLNIFDAVVRRTTELAALSALLLALAVLLLGPIAVNVLTDLAEVRESAADMRGLAALYVLLSFAAFQLDGIFIGVSFTRAMRNAAMLSISVFIAASWLLLPEFGVTGLWLAMVLYVVARALSLLLYYPALRASIAPASV